MEITEAIVQAGIVAIIRNVQSGKLTSQQATLMINARVAELSPEDGAAYRRLVARVAMDMPTITANWISE